VSKKKSFVLVSLIAALGFWATNWLATWFASQIFWLNGLVLAFFVLLLLYFLFRKQFSSWKDFLPVAILPCFLSVSFSWFSPLLSASIVWQLVFSVAFLGSFYLILLTENLFVVSSRFKAVPLYRTAFVTGFAFSLLIGLLLFNAILSLEFPAWVNTVFISLMSFFLYFHIFWTVNIVESEKKNFVVYALVGALLNGQLALVISFWPLSTMLKALYLVSWLYVLGGVFQAELRGRLFNRILKEYLFIGGAALFALFFSGGWLI